VETIGQFANFTIHVEYWGVGESYNNTRIVDTLPAGLAYDSYECGGTCGSLNVSGSTLTWDLGNFTGNRIVTINLSTIVNNTLGNQNGTILLNKAEAFHEGENGTIFDGDDMANVTIVEPDLDIDKSTAPEGPFETGDEIQYTINVNHTVESSSDAYDLVITDDIPAGLTFVFASQTSNPVSTSFGQIGQNLTWTYLELNQTTGYAVLTYNVTIDSEVTGNLTLINNATVNWTSMSGDADHERNGNGTGPNDYYDNDTAPIDIVNATTLIKLPDESRSRTIGDSANYTIEVDLPNATVLDLWINDTLPKGLIYNLSSLEIEDQLGNNISLELDSETVSPTNDGTQIVTINWSFGDFNNSDNKDIVINFEAIIANVASNQNGETLANNSASFNWLDKNGESHNGSDESGPVVVIEPDLYITKTTDPSGPFETGDELQYTINVTHTVNSTSDAYDLVITDDIPVGLTFVSQTSTPTSASFTPSGQNLTWTYLELNQTTGYAVLTYNVTIDSDVTSNLTLVNNATVNWTSMPGDNDHERNGNGTGPNDYYDNDTAPIDIVNATTLIKLPDDVRSRTIGDVVNYTIEIDLPNATVLDLWINDTLPKGLIYNLSSLEIEDQLGNNISLELDSETVSPTNDGTQIVTINWSFGDFNNSDNKDIVINFEAIIANVASNQNGETLANNSASFNWLDKNGESHNGSDESGPVVVIEPDLDIGKSADPNTNITVGDIVQYTITVNHTVASTADAYDLFINDTLPDGFSFINQSSNPAEYNFTSNGQNLTWEFLNLSQVVSGITIVYNVSVINDEVSNLTLINQANATWTSMPGDNLYERKGEFTDLNDYNDTTSVVSCVKYRIMHSSFS